MGHDFTMKFKKQQCGDCGEWHNVCPSCGGNFLTLFESQDPSTPQHGPMEFIRGADRGDSEEFKNMCWDCGWSETYTISVD